MDLGIPYVSLIVVLPDHSRPHWPAARGAEMRIRALLPRLLAAIPRDQLCGYFHRELKCGVVRYPPRVATEPQPSVAYQSSVISSNEQ